MVHIIPSLDSDSLRPPLCGGINSIPMQPGWESNSVSQGAPPPCPLLGVGIVEPLNR